MKKNIFVLLLFCFSFSYAQSKFKPGLYVSQGDQKGIELKINQDDTYELIFLSGKIQNDKDTLLLKNKYFGESLFQVEEVKNAVSLSKLEINFSYKYFDYYSSNIFIGLQQTENDIVEYKNILEYIDNNESEREEDKIKFSVDRPKYIYLLKKESSKTAMSKFLINENVSGLDIKTTSNSISNLELKAYFKDENSIIVTEGKQPLLFTMVNQDVIIPDATLNPIEVNNDAKVALPEKPEYSVEVPTEDISSATPYVFKHKVDKTLKGALETLKKSPNKFLVVAQNSSKEDFNLFIKQNEAEITDLMYYEYYPEYDKYNYYLATEKDKKLIQSNSKEKQILILNTEGEILYHTKGSLEENKKSFETYSSINQGLVRANIYATIDGLFANKKSTVQEVKEVFSKIIEMEITYDYAVIDGTADYTVIDGTAITGPQIEPSTKPSVEEVVEVDDAVEVVDTSASVISEDYDVIKDKQNLYQLKITKEEVIGKWEQVLEFYFKQNKLDYEVVRILKKELANEGFYKKLFNSEEKTFSALDYKGLDYLLKFYSQIKIADTTEVEKEYDYNYDQNIDEAISGILNKRASPYYDYSKEDKLKALGYYKKYLEVTNDKTRVITDYLSLLNNNLDILDSKIEYYNTYENYYNTIVQSNNKSVIEALDEVFTNSGGLIDWFVIKNDFSTLANNASWSVVKNETDVQLIKKAIIWSETSLKLTKDNGYFLDTLAQLYFKDGQKQKAIQTQQKALEVMKDQVEGGEGSETYIEMKSVLEKMQNGTY